MTLERFLLGGRAAMATAACVALLALAALAGEAILVLEAGRAALAGLPATIERQAREQGRETRTALLGAVEGLSRAAERQLEGVRHDAVQEIRGLRVTLDRRLMDATERLDARAAGLQRDASAELTLTRVDLTAALERAGEDMHRVGVLAESAKRTTDVMAESAEVLFDPRESYSLPNKAIGFMQAGERAARVIAEELPATATAVRESSQNIAVVTERFAKPTPWWQKVLSGIGSFATGYNLLRK